MKFKNTAISQGVNILANDHYVAIPYDCSDIKATDGVIPAGTIIPANDNTAVGVLLNDVVLVENPNGTIVIHGFIKNSKLPTMPTAGATTALKSVNFVTDTGVPIITKFAITYDANGGTGSVTDNSSPYDYGSEVTVKASTGITAPSGKTFSGWALTADATTKNDDYDPNDKFTITGNITLYAVYA